MFEGFDQSLGFSLGGHGSASRFFHLWLEDGITRNLKVEGVRARVRV